MSRQLAFDLPPQTARGRASYFVTPSNAMALAAMDAWRGWPLGRMLLTGSGQAGKTHLAHVWAGGVEGRVISAAELSRPGVMEGELPDLCEAALVVEDLDAVPGGIGGVPQAEEALFHIINLMAERRLPLLLTARGAPRDWGLGLADLISRLQATPVTRLEAPDDALLAAVMLKLFADRQIAVAPGMVGYLVTRMERSFEAAAHLVAELDARALSEGRAITRGVAASVLADLFPQDEAGPDRSV